VVANSRQVTRDSASADSVRGAVEAIDNVQPELSYVDVRRGILTGLVLRTKRFEIVDGATGATYKGYMTDDAANDANGLSVGDQSFVTARIRVETPFTNDQDDTTGIKQVLESIAAFVPAEGGTEGDLGREQSTP